MSPWNGKQAWWNRQNLWLEFPTVTSKKVEKKITLTLQFYTNS